MKDFQELIEQTTEIVETDKEKDQLAENILRTLEKTEFYLKRKLTESEFNMFSDLLLEEDMKSDKKKSPSSFIKDTGNWVVEIITPKGKTQSVAKTRKGLLDTISKVRKRGAKFRVLDATKGKQDITSKINKVITDRAKEEEIRKDFFGKSRKKKKFLKNSVSWSEFDVQDRYLEESKGSFFKKLMGKFLGSSTKETAQQGVETAAKETVQQGTESAARETGEEMVERGAREAGEEMVEKGAREAGEEMVERGAREAGEKAAKSGTKRFLKKAAGPAAAAATGFGAATLLSGSGGSGGSTTPTESDEGDFSYSYGGYSQQNMEGNTTGEIDPYEGPLNIQWGRKRR
jgi:hypothetical protein